MGLGAEAGFGFVSEHLPLRPCGAQVLGGIRGWVKGEKAVRGPRTPWPTGPGDGEDSAQLRSPGKRGHQLLQDEPSSIRRLARMDTRQRCTPEPNDRVPVLFPLSRMNTRGSFSKTPGIANISLGRRERQQQQSPSFQW